MSSSKPVHDLLTLTGKAPGTVTAHRAVGFDDAQATVAGQRVKGVAVSAAVTGAAYPIKAKGTEVIETGLAIGLGDDLVTDSQGRAVPAQASAISVAITGITAANPGVVTAEDHGLKTGDVIVITGVGGMVEVNNQAFMVTAIDADTFSIGNTTGNTPYTNGGTASKVGPDGSAGHVFASALEAASGAGKFIEILLK
ncbi:MAG: ubiquitin-activating E1 FCCH domain-containing protein [Sinimarinibacterium flocculans]|jgi:hypothetical protein|uniref:ubiquitin-activating E1 FCCH domain-containing protein n=1 Tax=Sinimarinibacterium flocculans TaxID=985250 RepID=UPI003C6A33F6